MALKGLKVVEFAGLAPAPFCGLIFSDFGANVIRVEKVQHSFTPDFLTRGKKSIAVDLKRSEGQSVLKKLCSTADVLIEPFRPGIMEKLNLGPQQLLALNKKLIYARLSGFGQNGPLANEAGHDINYLAISGILSALGGKRLPAPPINILGDFAGGGLLCALGICMALLERQKSGAGQVIDANIVEGTSYVSSYIWHSRKSDNDASQILWPNPHSRESNLLDGGAPFYRVYETKDNKFMAVGALEPQFYASFIVNLGLDPNSYSQFDVPNHEKMHEIFAVKFKEKTQREWEKIFEGKDACVTPVVDIAKAKDYEHNKARGSFLNDGTPRPAPLLSRTPTNPCLIQPKFAEHTREILCELGYSVNEINRLAENKVVRLGDLNSNL
ncbi:Alpha-methylacyl-CoA racemase-like protein [Dinothrombium tinctorium]|uniref:Alpha-methylacyl-CoA racemase-like protein n=1 Tax=Dinothrombium tinctorium TaxID=1965070 RepID=A0A443RMD6_9ACAR|nr:Alpha-methylacyl-CoA racemase-like protein [Dinothrombium tinctorium]